MLALVMQVARLHGWRACMGSVLAWVAWLACLGGWRAKMGSVGGVRAYRAWVAC